MILGEAEDLKLLSISRGSVFRMTLYPEDGIVPKGQGDKSRDKYFIVLGRSEDGILAGVVLINSKINERLFWKIADYQHMLLSSVYGFLNEMDRYADCYNILELSVAKIKGKGEYVGFLNEEDINEIIKLTRKSPVISEDTIKKYGLNP